jgi:hypothetical protein
MALEIIAGLLFHVARVADELRDRRVGGKAVFRVEP